MEGTNAQLINCRLHLFLSSASSFSSQYLLLFLKSSRSCVLLLPTPFISVICPSMASWRRQFLLRIWPCNWLSYAGYYLEASSSVHSRSCSLVTFSDHFTFSLFFFFYFSYSFFAFFFSFSSSFFLIFIFPLPFLLSTPFISVICPSMASWRKQFLLRCDQFNWLFYVGYYLFKYNLDSREKFEPGPGFKPRTSIWYYLGVLFSPIRSKTCSLLWARIFPSLRMRLEDISHTSLILLGGCFKWVFKFS